MPEGPEIRRSADELRTVLSGNRIESVRFGLERLQRFASRLLGVRVDAVEAHGKAIVIRFDGGLNLYSHNQLYGRWFVVRRGMSPDTARTLRVALETRDASALLYSASDVDVLTDDALARHPYLERLGPDVLAADIGWSEVALRLEAPKFRRRSLASLYLDQSFLAGIGNYLRSEILFFSRIDPRRSPASLSPAQVRRLARESLRVSRRSYRTGGITNSPRVVKDLKRQGVAREEYRFAVFSREGRPCRLCGDAIRRIELASRRLYYCPSCQQTRY